MAGKKAKPHPAKPTKAPAKAHGKTAGKVVAKATKPANASKTVAKSAKKGGMIGSVKKMLGLSSATASKKPAAQPATAVKGAKPAAAAKPTRKAATSGSKAKGGQAGKAGAPLTSLTLKPQAQPVEVSGPGVCREVACELISTTGHYCRMHYIKNWKKIKRKEIIIKERKLNHYIEELVSKYPDKYIEAIRQDLASEKDFAKVIADLEIDEALDDFESVETESAEGIIDNIKRDFEDDGDVF